MKEISDVTVVTVLVGVEAVELSLKHDAPNGRCVRDCFQLDRFEVLVVSWVGVDS